MARLSRRYLSERLAEIKGEGSDERTMDRGIAGPVGILFVERSMSLSYRLARWRSAVIVAIRVPVGVVVVIGANDGDYLGLLREEVLFRVEDAQSIVKRRVGGRRERHEGYIVILPAKG